MSDKSQYLKMFLDESAEYIQLLNEKVLELENNPTDQKEIVAAVFRAIHSLKGMAATMGYNTLTELTHRMENALDEVRQGRIAVNTRLIDLLLAGLDHISDLVEGVKEHGEERELPANNEIDSYLEEISRFLEEEEGSTGESPAGEEAEVLEIAGEELGELSKNLSPGESLYRAVVSLDSSSEFAVVRGYMVLNKARELGELIQSDPDSKNLEEGMDFGNSLTLFLTTNFSPEEIQLELGDIIDVLDVEVTEVKVERSADTGEEVSTNTAKNKEKNGDKKSKDHLQFSSTVRVDIQKLDHLMNMVGELLINKTRLETLNINLGKYKDILTQLDRVTMELHHIVMQIRMVPVGVMFNRFPRMVRDLSHQMGKEIDFRIEGEETELDRSIIDELSDPLIHLLRNSIDHGIELPEEREKLGKDEVGQVLLRASQKGSEILIEVKDDGRGIDADKLVKSALEKGIISEEEAGQLEEREKLNLIFEPGFSTAKEISDISGRGVGLDVVKKAVEKLDGQVYLESTVNKGTRFLISLPLTLAITRALMVKIAGETFAIPLNAIKETQILNKQEIRQVKGQDVVLLRDKTIPLINSREILNLEIMPAGRDGRDEVPVVIINAGERQLGLIVDELLDQQEIVIKSLSDYFHDVKNISGATIIGDGDVALILDVRNIA